MHNKSSLLATLLAAALTGSTAFAQQPQPDASASSDYPLQTCVVSDEPLGDEPVEYLHQQAGQPDRLIRFCCDGCVDDFKADPAKFLAKLDSAAKRPASGDKTSSAAGRETSAAVSIADQKADYPLEVCAVSGEALGSMGTPYEHVHQEAGKPDRLVLMCCKGCVKKFNKEPAKYLARIDSAAKSR